MPEPEISVRGAFAHRRSHTGVLAAMMALESGDSLYPKPSRIINTTGLGAAVIRLLAVVEEVRETPCRRWQACRQVYLAGVGVSCPVVVLQPGSAVYT